MNNVKLNVGPSPIWRKSDWFTLDHKPSRVDKNAILGDANNIPLEPNSCSTIFCSHVIEHIPNFKFEEVLVEFNRVMEKDGLIRILTPDLHKIAKAYVEKNNTFFKKLLLEDESLRTDLGYGGTFMNCIVSPGQDTVLFNNQLNEFIGGLAHVYLYDFEMLKTLLERYGYNDIKQKIFCESEFKEYEEPLHVEGMEPIWQDLNQEFFSKHNLIHRYNAKERLYETNFTITGFDRDPTSSLIIEAKKYKNVEKLNIQNNRGYEYSKSLLDNHKFKLKCKIFNTISKVIDSENFDGE